MRALRYGFAIVLLAMFLPCSAQGQGTEFGFKGGVNIATLAAEVVGDFDSRTGIIVGGSFAFNLSPMFSIQPELLYAMKGTEFSTLRESGTLKYDYLEIPVLARLRIPTAPGSSLRPSLFVGPALGIELSCDVEGESDGVAVSGPCSDFRNDLKTTDFGLVFGGELGLDRGGMRIGLEARYNLGLTSIIEEGPRDRKNRAFSIMATIAFGG